jgi:protein-L-isoaspartate(D-aspartate) O-methyltransferase
MGQTGHEPHGEAEHRDRHAKARERMVEEQLVARGITDRRVLDAMREVPREAFVAEWLKAEAYADRPLPIEAAQTISQPYIVALMIEAAALGPHDRALEIGAGSGYAAAVMARLAKEVVAIERHPQLARLAAERLRALAIDNVDVQCDDGSAGCPARAPFDAILVAASGPRVPHVLVEQLAPGGRIVMPIGAHHDVQRLVRVTRLADGGEREDTLCGVAFVPLIGREGWPGGAPDP